VNLQQLLLCTKWTDSVRAALEEKERADSSKAARK
jgi:hypothetical protein